MLDPYFLSYDECFKIIQGDCLNILPTLSKNSINMIFADPPYFLSNDGLTVKSGIIQSVNKGQWDKIGTIDENYAFTYKWIEQAKMY